MSTNSLFLNCEKEATTYIFKYRRKIMSVMVYLYQLPFSPFTYACKVAYMLHQLLLYNKMNQLYIHISPPLDLPTSPPQPSRSPESTELSPLLYTAGSHQLFYTCSAHASVPISQFIPQSPSACWCRLICFLCLCLYSCPAKHTHVNFKKCLQ